MADPQAEKEAESEADAASAFLIVWDPSVVSPEQYARLVTALGDLVRAHGGAGVQRIQAQFFRMAEKIE